MRAYKAELIYERHRHRFEFNNKYREQLTDWFSNRWNIEWQFSRDC